jgi:hypothetical protein
MESVINPFEAPLQPIEENQELQKIKEMNENEEDKQKIPLLPQIMPIFVHGESDEPKQQFIKQEANTSEQNQNTIKKEHLNFATAFLNKIMSEESNNNTFIKQENQEIEKPLLPSSNEQSTKNQSAQSSQQQPENLSSTTTNEDNKETSSKVSQPPSSTATASFLAQFLLGQFGQTVTNLPLSVPQKQSQPHPVQQPTNNELNQQPKVEHPSEDAEEGQIDEAKKTTKPITVPEEIQHQPPEKTSDTNESYYHVEAAVNDSSKAKQKKQKDKKYGRYTREFYEFVKERHLIEGKKPKDKMANVRCSCGRFKGTLKQWNRHVMKVIPGKLTNGEYD